MIMVNILDVMPEIAGIFTSYIFAAILFSCGLHFHRHGWYYSALLLALAAGTSIDLVLDTTNLILIVNGKDPGFLEFFILPVCVFAQSIMTLLAILRMLHANMHQLQKLIVMILLMILLVLIYPFLYSYTLSGDKPFWDIANYTQFANTTIARLITEAVIIVMIIYTAFAVVSIVKGFRYYCDVLCTYLSIDLGPILKRCIAWLALGVLYTLFSILNIEIDTSWMRPVHYVTVTTIFACMIILILCNHERLERIEQAFRYIKRSNVEVIPGIAYGITITQRAEPQPEDVERVRTIMEHWIARSDMPFRQRGITVQSVADEMGLPTDVVLKYINIIYGMNFHDWIQDLRISDTDSK